MATVAPGDYPVPLSGPTGTMLDQLGRHGYRAAHIHFKIHADGHDEFTTMMYFQSFALRGFRYHFLGKGFQSRPVEHADPAEIAEKGLDKPFYTLDYTFVLP